jgi:hypothetical protein
MKVRHAELKELTQVLRRNLEYCAHEIKHASLCVHVAVLRSAQELNRLFTELSDVLLLHHDHRDCCLEKDVVDVRLNDAEKLRDAD